MALGARRRTGSTYALSITGVAGPAIRRAKRRRWAPSTSAWPTPPAATWCTAQFLGDRTRIRTFATQMALDLLRKKFGLVGV